MYRWNAGPHRPIKKLPNWLIAILVLLFIIAALQIIIPKTSANSEPVYIQHTVSPGETLWGIAKHYRPDADPREVIWEIREVNGIDPVIRPGQVIWVPAN